MLCCVCIFWMRLVEEARVDMEVLDYGGYNALDYSAACHWHHPDRPPMLGDGKLAPMDIASYLKSQGMKYTWFGAALAEDIDRLWEFLDNGQDPWRSRLVVLVTIWTNNTRVKLAISPLPRNGALWTVFSTQPS